MTTVEQRDQGLDSGYIAIVGHRLLGSAAVVLGALNTLQADDGAMSAAQEALLQRQMVQHLESITAIGRSLIQATS